MKFSKRSAFTLLELVFGIAIASMLGMALFTILSQSLKSMQYVEATSGADRLLMGMYQRLEKDIVGITIPLYGDPTKKPEKENKNKQNVQVAQDAKKSELAKVKIDESYMENYLILEHENNLIKKFSFISSNPFIFYGESLPWLVRITYTLKETGDGRYALQRSQSTIFDDFSSPSFTVCEDLVSLKVILTFATLNKENDSDKAESADESFTYKKYEKFPIEDEDFDYPLPITVTIEGVYFDIVSGREQAFSYAWHMPTWHSSIKPVPVSKYKMNKKVKKSISQRTQDGTNEGS